MKPERIEEILNKSFAADEPKGMRDRVISRASRELRPARSIVRINFKAAFACTALAFVLLANVSDHARCQRLAGGYSGYRSVSPAVAKALIERQRLTMEALNPAQPLTDRQERRKPL